MAPKCGQLLEPIIALGFQIRAETSGIHIDDLLLESFEESGDGHDEEEEEASDDGGKNDGLGEL